jgi:hypothetical protein
MSAPRGAEFVALEFAIPEFAIMAHIRPDLASRNNGGAM